MTFLVYFICYDSNEHYTIFVTVHRNGIQKNVYFYDCFKLELLVLIDQICR
jgi:hypothetical protein